MPFCGCGGFPLTCHHDDHTFHRWPRPQVEVRRLAMPKRAACTFRSIVGRFPVRITQKLAEVLKLGRHPFLHPPQRRHRHILSITAPGGEALACITHSTAVPLRIVPEQKPLLQKTPRRLELRPNRTDQQCVNLRLLVGCQMIPPTQEEVAMLLEIFPYLANFIPLLPG
jgi:hypothetical protein